MDLLRLLLAYALGWFVLSVIAGFVIAAFINAGKGPGYRR